METTDLNTTVMDFKRAKVSVRLALNYAAGTSAQWPDQTHALFPFVPLNDALTQLEASLNAYSEKVTDRIQGYLNSHMTNSTRACEAFQAVDNVCTSATDMPLLPCNGCDTCCKCLVQQRCDGECAKCACINCSAFNYDLAFLIALAFMFVFVVAYIVLRFAAGPKERSKRTA